ncbi:FecCD family ABC transporter permease [Saccharomonospora xinjiangensis]|uniref:ABC-type enterobactin transport system, permease component n=1 Tax=Saccharomonospora xinjiangensis XJ-54 TaxID=882086 RepID=I0V1L3_9PSEU|nr:iron chelate uptake ABC transporter family permease subunit [Saccharomonospora xinjiangensis]EID54016.1 ABC-type enterobactin transport system, permease component [Saccharomonospora xinjiangensis XJ-54]
MNVETVTGTRSADTAGRPVTGKVLRTRREAVALRLPTRTILVGAALALAVLVTATITLTTGEFELSIPEVLAVLVGNGEGAADFIVGTLRLPRLLTALFVGAALAVSGAVLQSLMRNPLGSPDFVGFTNGASTGALVVLITIGGGMTQVALGALVGGISTALLVYLLSYRRGVQGYRFVLMGVGINALALSVNSYLITRANIYDAVSAQAWLIGSVNSRGWEHVAASGLALAVLLPVAASQVRALSMLELGDHAAGALGVGVQRTRAVLITVSVLLAGFATAAAGPIWFVALAAPQLARRLTRGAAPGLITSALMGGLLLTVSDLAMDRLFAAQQLPVGTATGLLGGLYLMWLLASEWRGKGRYA